MPTTVWGLVNGKSSVNTLSAAEVNGLGDALELLAVQLGELHAAGCFLSTDFNASVVGGTLAVDISAGSAFVGGTDGKKLVMNTGTVRVSGLTASATNYVYLQRDGTFTTNTSGTPPANTLLVATAATSGTEATSVNNNPTGRVNLRAAAIADVNSSTVDATYGTEEQNVITDLRTKLNSVLAAMRAQGIIAS